MSAVPMVSLVLHGGESLALLRQGLENYRVVNASLSLQCEQKALVDLSTRPLRETEALQRRAEVYAERRDLLSALLEQLPSDIAPVPAPLGAR